MNKLVVLICICAIAQSEHRSHGNGRRDMLDLNRTPRREINEDEDGIFGTERSCDIRGNWYNQHGSELILNQTDDGKLIGEFRTAVRLKYEFGNQDYTSPTDYVVPVRGEIFGKLFTFHAYFREKKISTVWSGQCQRRCNLGWLRSDREILHTSWLMTSETNQCEDYWMATRIGEDIFTRLPVKSGPRRANTMTQSETN